jgi:hypothetical protein
MLLAKSFAAQARLYIHIGRVFWLIIALNSLPVSAPDWRPLPGQCDWLEASPALFFTPWYFSFNSFFFFVETEQGNQKFAMVPLLSCPLIVII